MKSDPGASRRGGRFPGRTAAAGFAAIVLSATLAAACGLSPAAGTPRAAASSPCPWLSRSLPAGQRVSLLLSRMTLPDKINMVTGAGNIPAIPRLCIPAINLQDGPNGAGDGLTGVTQLPAGVSLAASWDRSLAAEYGKVIGAEERGKGKMVNLGPTVNVDRDPRWGRSFEAYTEDPFLNASITVPVIDGVQSQGVMSQVKHFAVYNQETNRNTPADDAIVSTRALHEIYLPAFWAATRRAKAASVMCSYSTVNGQAACQNPYLLTTTLKQRWAFPGFVGSDFSATHSTVASADAGLDQEMPGAAYYGRALAAAVKSGQVAVATVNEMVSRILTEMFRFDDFNNPPAGSAGATVTTPAHQAVSAAVAEAGTVLLKNEGGTLPLKPWGGGTVAVIGPAASAAPADAGGGSAHVTSPFSVTPLQGLRAAAGPGATVSYTQGLPTDTSLSPIPSSSLTRTGTLTAPQTGTYVLALKSVGRHSALSVDGAQVLANPGLPPTTTYSVGVSLRAGQRYAVRVSGGPAASLS